MRRRGGGVGLGGVARGAIGGYVGKVVGGVLMIGVGW